MSGPAPWDPGLQNERTGLAWQRTMLAGLACCLAVSRLLAEVSLLLAVVTGSIGLLGTVGFGWVALRRFRRHGNALHTDRSLEDGRLPAAISLVVVATAVAALVFAVLA